jgi:hypothetical protein
LEKKAWGWQRFEGFRLGKELGAPTVLFIGLVKKIVASDRGTYPEKLGRWRGFLDRFAVGSFGIQSWVVFSWLARLSCSWRAVRVWHYLTTSYRMDRSELQSKSCKEKESELIEGKCYKNG